jgi:hypothetical protein
MHVSELTADEIAAIEATSIPWGASRYDQEMT